MQLFGVTTPLFPLEAQRFQCHHSGLLWGPCVSPLLFQPHGAAVGQGPAVVPWVLPWVPPRTGLATATNWVVLGAALLHPLICITEPLFALINVSAKCLMCEISFLLAGIDGAVWDSRLLRFPGQDSANQPGVVSLGFWCTRYQLAGISPPP